MTKARPNDIGAGIRLPGTAATRVNARLPRSRGSAAQGILVTTPGVLAWEFGAKMPANTLEEET